MLGAYCVSDGSESCETVSSLMPWTAMTLPASRRNASRSVSSMSEVGTTEKPTPVLVPVDVVVGTLPVLSVVPAVVPIPTPPPGARLPIAVTSAWKPSASVCVVLAGSLESGLSDPDQIVEYFAIRSKIVLPASASVRYLTMFGAAPHCSVVTRSITLYGPSTPYAAWMSLLLRMSNDVETCFASRLAANCVPPQPYSDALAARLRPDCRTASAVSESALVRCPLTMSLTRCWRSYSARLAMKRSHRSCSCVFGCTSVDSSPPGAPSTRPYCMCRAESLRRNSLDQ